MSARLSQDGTKLLILIIVIACKIAFKTCTKYRVKMGCK